MWSIFTRREPTRRSGMAQIRIVTALIMVAGFVLVGLTYMLPEPATAAAMPDFDFHATLGFLVFLTFFAVGGVVLFLLGLPGFTSDFRKTYYLISIGLLIQAVGTLLYPLSFYLGARFALPSLVTGDTLLTVGIILMFVGLRHFALLLQMNSWLTKQSLIIGTTLLVIAVAAWLIPNRSVTIASPDSIAAIRHSLMAVQVLFYVGSTLLAAEVRRSASVMYSRSMLYVVLGMASCALSAAFLLLNEATALPTWMSVSLLGIPFAISNFLFMAAGYSFNGITRRQQVIQDNGDALLDSIMYLASFASNPREVDPILNVVRQVTARREADRPFTHAEKERLTKVYFELEEYLLTQERLREFERESLRRSILERFNWSPGGTTA